MNRTATVLLLIVMATPAMAQGIDCDLAENAERDECLALPPTQEATNFVFGIAPLLLGAGAIGAVIASGNEGTSTPSTNPQN